MVDSLKVSISHFRAGAYVIVEGKQQADRFFIIKSGKIRLSKEVTVVNEAGSDVLNPGDFFGVVSAMSSHNYIETAQAIDDVTLIMVRREHYPQLIKKNATVAMKIIEYFSRRMRYLDNALAAITLKNVSEPSLDHLYEMGQYYQAQSLYNQAYYTYYQYVKLLPQGKDAHNARMQLAKLEPMSKAVYLDGSDQEFMRTYPEGTMIFAETMPGQELYIIQQGSVKITKIINNNEVLLAVLKQGDIFGEMSLIEDKPRSASALAFENAVLLAVNKQNFARMVTSQPQVIARLTILFAERIWLIYKQLANTQIADEVGKLYYALWTQLEKARIPIRSGQNHQFDFGTRELINMVGLSLAEGNVAARELLQDKKMQVVNNRLVTSDVADIVKQAEYYHKMQRIATSRTQAKHSTK